MKEEGLLDRIVLEKFYLLDERNFKLFIDQARAKQVDGVHIALFSGALSSFAKQAKNQGLNADLFGAETFEDINEVQASDGALVGSWYVNADDAIDSFKNAYKAEYGEVPGYGAANAFDAMNLIFAAFAKHQHNNKAIASYLNTVKEYQGASGSYSATGDNRFDLPAAVKIVTANGFKKLF